MNDEPKKTGRWKNHPPHAILKCAVCGATFTVTPARVNKAKYCCYACHQVGEGRKGGAVRGEQLRGTGEGKAYRKFNGRHLHRIVAERKIGRALVCGETVHHVDGDIQNNKPENIEVLPSQGEHMAKHRNEMLAARKAKHGY